MPSSTQIYIEPYCTSQRGGLLNLSWIAPKILQFGYRTSTTLMAFVLRRWRVLLVLNVVAVAGFMTLWTKCTHTRVAKTIGQDDVKRQSRSNGTAQGLSISHEVLLKRLGSLEDVVYRQLNGRLWLFSTLAYPLKNNDYGSLVTLYVTQNLPWLLLFTLADAKDPPKWILPNGTL